jgi:hypothetical protein
MAVAEFLNLARKTIVELNLRTIFYCITSENEGGATEEAGPP